MPIVLSIVLLSHHLLAGSHLVPPPLLFFCVSGRCFFPARTAYASCLCAAGGRGPLIRYGLPLFTLYLVRRNWQLRVPFTPSSGTGLILCRRRPSYKVGGRRLLLWPLRRLCLPPPPPLLLPPLPPPAAAALASAPPVAEAPLYKVWAPPLHPLPLSSPVLSQ